MTDQPHPVGDPVTAFRQTLARARRAENTVRELRAEIKNLRAQKGTQNRQGDTD